MAGLEDQYFDAFSAIAFYLADIAVTHEQTNVVQITGTDETVRVETFRNNGLPIIAYWIPETIDNTQKDIRRREILIEGVDLYDFNVIDIVSNSSIDLGTYEVSRQGVLFNNLPVTDYPFILHVNTD